MTVPKIILFAAVTMIACTANAKTIADSTVTVESGQAEGGVSDGVASWKGIPYAAPPLGLLRWRAPQPVIPWSGVRQAVSYGHDCMQTPFPGDAAPLGVEPGEDCLYLNIWRSTVGGRKIPVIVWIYGGGFVNGGASPPTYSGANLARQGVMVVSFNYRLGRFGTFAHPQLSHENADSGHLGNYGYMDQIAALRWVQRNIAAFGGNPSNVTLVGESAGGVSVHMLVTSPLTAGLFQKAVVMSGGAGAPMSDADLTTVEKVGVDFAQWKGIAPDDAQSVPKLRALPAEEVTSGLNMMTMFMSGGGARTFASPFVDGRIAVDPIQAYRSGSFHRVPMMIGSTSDDLGGRTGVMVAGARSLSAMLSDMGVPVYEYRFSYVPDAGRNPQIPGATHASDIPFFFNTETIKYGDRTTARDVTMGRITSTYLVNFAKTGDPNGAGQPVWPRYSRNGDRLMDFNEAGQAVAGKDPRGSEIDASSSPAAR